MKVHYPFLFLFCLVLQSLIYPTFCVLINVFTLCCIPFLIVWIYLVYKNKAFVHRIHLVMIVLLRAKAFHLLCAAEDKFYIKITCSRGARKNIQGATIRKISGRTFIIFEGGKFEKKFRTIGKKKKNQT